jgi:DNA-binding Lrp family transcriptional regulator
VDTPDSGRDLGGRLSAAIVLFHYAVAETLGLTAADSKALEIVTRHQPVTVSRLAQLTRLSPSATTSLVDRLESAGFVRRQPAAGDRRKIHVVVDGAHPVLGQIFGSLGAAMHRMMARYSTAELLVIKDYVEHTIEVLQGETERLSRSG